MDATDLIFYPTVEWLLDGATGRVRPTPALELILIALRLLGPHALRRSAAKCGLEPLAVLAVLATDIATLTQGRVHLPPLPRGREHDLSAVQRYTHHLLTMTLRDKVAGPRLRGQARALGISPGAYVRRIAVTISPEGVPDPLPHHPEAGATWVEESGNDAATVAAPLELALVLILLALVLLSQKPTSQDLVLAPRSGAPPGADRSPRARRLALTARSSTSASEAGHASRPTTGGGTASTTVCTA